MRVVICAVFLVLSIAAHAQGNINAERPGFSSSPLALDYRRWQVEAGYRYQRVGSSMDAQTLPLLLLRYGAGERAEVQFSWAGLNRIDAGVRDINGSSDASIGVKWQLTDDAATTPVGVFASLSLPVGDNELSSNEIDPSLGLFWAHQGWISLFGTVLLSEFDKESTIGNAVGINLPVSDRCRGCGAYVEYFGNYTEHKGPQHNLNAGMTFLRSADLQFDVHAGFGLNDRAPDGFIGFGAAYRF